LKLNLSFYEEEVIPEGMMHQEGSHKEGTCTDEYVGKP